MGSLGSGGSRAAPTLVVDPVGCEATSFAASGRAPSRGEETTAHPRAALTTLGEVLRRGPQPRAREHRHRLLLRDRDRAQRPRSRRAGSHVGGGSTRNTPAPWRHSGYAGSERVSTANVHRSRQYRPRWRCSLQPTAGHPWVSCPEAVPMPRGSHRCAPSRRSQHLLWWTARRHLAAGGAGRVPPLSARQAQPTVQVGTDSDHRDRRRLELHHRGRWSEASGVMPPNAGSELETGR
jgi:hypothetical protein